MLNSCTLMRFNNASPRPSKTLGSEIVCHIDSDEEQTYHRDKIDVINFKNIHKYGYSAIPKNASQSHLHRIHKIIPVSTGDVLMAHDGI